MNKLFLQLTLIAGFSCSSLLFCPSQEEITHALQDLSAPEVQGTSEQERARTIYLEYQQKYVDLINEIECHLASNSDAEQLTDYADMLSSFLSDIQSVINTLTKLCELVASSQKDALNIQILVEDLLNTQHKLVCMRKNLKKQFTATNIAIAQAVAENEEAPQHVIMEDCQEQRPRKPFTSKPLPDNLYQDVPFEDANDVEDVIETPVDTTDLGFDLAAFLAEEDDESDDQARIRQGALAQQAITAARPMAEIGEFEVVGKPCAAQGMTLNCGYHAVCNAQVIAKVIESMHILKSPINFDNIPLPTRTDILLCKNNFLRTTAEIVNPASAITGFTLAAFAEFNNALTSTPETPRIFQANTQPALYFDALEYMQNKEREIIVDILELVAFFRASEENQQRILTFLQGFVVDNEDGTVQTLFPDVEQAIPGTPFSTETLKNAYLFWRAQVTRGSYETYTNALTAFKTGKTLVMPWLSHSGEHAGCGHWTCKVFVPEKRNGAVVQNFVKIINVDSCDASGQHAHIDDNVKRFVFDLLHLELPSTTDLETIASMFNPQAIFAERYVMEEIQAASRASAEIAPVTTE